MLDGFGKAETYKCTYLEEPCTAAPELRPTLLPLVPDLNVLIHAATAIHHDRVGVVKKRNLILGGGKIVGKARIFIRGSRNMSELLHFVGYQPYTKLDSGNRWIPAGTQLTLAPIAQMLDVLPYLGFGEHIWPICPLHVSAP